MRCYRIIKGNQKGSFCELFKNDLETYIFQRFNLWNYCYTMYRVISLISSRISSYTTLHGYTFIIIGGLKMLLWLYRRREETTACHQTEKKHSLCHHEHLTFNTYMSQRDIGEVLVT